MAKPAAPLIPTRRPATQPRQSKELEPDFSSRESTEAFIKGARIEKDSPRSIIPPKGPSSKGAITLYQDERDAIARLVARAREGSFVIGDEARAGSGVKTNTDNNVIRQLLLDGLRKEGVLK